MSISEKIRTWNTEKLKLIIQRNTLNEAIANLENKQQMYESLCESIKSAGGNSDAFDDIPEQFLETLASNNIRFTYAPKFTK